MGNTEFFKNEVLVGKARLESEPWLYRFPA